jgi:hypothetical protein
MGRNNKKGVKALELQKNEAELTITNAFLGAIGNLRIIENYLYDAKIIFAYNYFNYISLLALSIELGLKNIIKITNTIQKTHDLNELFIMADNETKNIFSEKFFKTNINYISKQDFFRILNEVKDLFEETRYCSGKSLRFFINNECMTKEGYIDLIKIAQENKPFIALRLLLAELIEYHNFNHTNAIKDIDINKDFAKQIEIIMKNKTKIQENLEIVEKQTPE